MVLIRFALGALVIATAVARAQGAAVQAAVERAVHVCAACHGEGGRSATPAIPSLAGQMPIYLSTQLKDFRGQTRAETDVQAYMWGVSALLDDATINGLADYFAGQSPATGKSGDARLISRGDKIFHSGIPAKGVRPCAGCHGARAEGAAVFPRLAGQNAEYIFRQLQVFGTRLRPHGVLMKQETAGISAEDERALAEYVQSL